jgi:hypothetical protein
MTEGKLNELFEEYSKVESPVERGKISYLLHGKIASDLENHAPGVDKIKTSMGDEWMAAAANFEKILKEDPDQAFKMAIQLVTLPVDPDQKIEDIYKWIRGDGAGILGREEIRDRLLDYFSDEEKSKGLVEKLNGYISYDFSEIRDSKTAFEDPGCYLALSAILSGVRIGKESGLPKNAQIFFDSAKNTLVDPNVVRVNKYYKGFPDTNPMAIELESFIDIK